MTSNERAQHDWFDQELDRLLAETSFDQAMEDSDPDHDLVQAAVQMQRLDLNQQSEPDDRFIRDLEKQLMPNVSYLAASRNAAVQNPIRTLYEHLVARITIERTQHRRTSRLASAFSIALLFAVIAATAFVAINTGNDGSDTPTASSALIGPTPTVPIVVVGASTPTPGYSGIKWVAPPPDNGDVELGGIASANSSVYRLISSESFTGVQALRASDGSILWESPTEWMPIIAADDNGVYFSRRMPDGQTQLVCLDPANGQQRWTASLPNGVNNIVAQADSIATLSDESFLQSGLVFVQDWTNQITAIDPILGTTVWQTSLSPTPPESETVVGTPVVSGNMLLAKSTRGTISAMFRINGSVQWTIEGVSGAQFTAVNGVAVIVEEVSKESETTRVTGHELVTGELLWTVDYSGSLSQPVARYDGSNSSIALVADSTDPIVIEAKTNDTSATPQVQPAYSSPVDEGESIVAIDPTNGLPKWTTPPISDAVLSLFLRVPEQGLFTILTNDGKVALIYPTNNQETPVELRYVEAWANSPVALDLTVGIIGRAPVANKSGVFIALADGSIIALDDGGVLSLRG